ncbi:hypothetical protein [Nocardioides sp.]|uniref:hypothetical protein n=1 Tax=Nocardioides sp. TaxID=35761 RepID=UPI002ED6A230
MPAGLTEADQPTRHLSAWWVVRDVLVVLAACAAAGALAGVVWEAWWTPPVGVVRDQAWYLDFFQSRDLFSATALYVVVGVVGGLLVGAASAFFVDRVELLTLATVVVGSLLAGWLMLQVGSALAPPDPHALARTAAEDTRLPGTLEVSGTWPRGAFPAGAMLGVAAIYIGLTASRRSPT